jgi:hypothetical protein
MIPKSGSRFSEKIMLNALAGLSPGRRSGSWSCGLATPFKEKARATGPGY